jgi:hypothetical protein
MEINGKIWKIWKWKYMLEASNQARNAFFVHFRPSWMQKKIWISILLQALMIMLLH